MNKEQKKQVEIQIESHRRTIQVLEDEKFMTGIFESMEAVARGEKGIPGKELKRKYKLA